MWWDPKEGPGGAHQGVGGLLTKAKKKAECALGYQLGDVGVQGWQYGRQREVAWHRGVPPESLLAADDDGGEEGGYAMVADTVQGHSHSLQRYRAHLQLDSTVLGGAAVAAAAAAERAGAAAAAAAVHSIAAAVSAAAAAVVVAVGVVAALSVSPVADFAAWAGSQEWT